MWLTSITMQDAYADQIACAVRTTESGCHTRKAAGHVLHSMLSQPRGTFPPIPSPFPSLSQELA
jgi:hypothetical protein